ncbi:aspartate 1-decarboxylase [Geomicrobium sp. JCM 19039]|uniref:aspartate 1-decarboxylase n=1 Tax=Geomicrobium sp. JCM 19039 TaxID=1460636 RepID=UPI00045F2CA4|nr:aspartate 1-decarboxylase [Geomicrobium sp. JCM 19039]GAK11953.1 aspartate 1-decarboxylase [Geomicrobium sp. JCM 19039]
MYRHMMKAKLHQAVVTEANLNYVGSITIDEDLLDAVDLMENEKVQVVNNNNGARLETYIIAGERGSGVVCLNGAAARLVQPGDTVIIIGYAVVHEQELSAFQPRVAIMNAKNEIIEMMGTEPAATVRTHD